MRHATDLQEAGLPGQEFRIRLSAPGWWSGLVSRLEAFPRLVSVAIDDPGEPCLHVFNVLRGEASQVRPTPFGDVGTVFSGQGIELVWVSKQAEPIDENWFCSDAVDLILVVQGQLKFEFESPRLPDRVLSPGEVLVLPAGERCRAYRWPRDAAEATVFVAAYPTGKNQQASAHAR
jgi:hypothetical protein